uniref:Uncharacterized protein n=1 Tax=Arundo donax TaxID=35708 RepID=A0A0A8YY55_ARUDO
MMLSYYMILRHMSSHNSQHTNRAWSTEKVQNFGCVLECS